MSRVRGCVCARGRAPWRAVRMGVVWGGRRRGWRRLDSAAGETRALTVSTNRRAPGTSKKPIPNPSRCSSARVAKPVKLNTRSVGVLALSPSNWHMVWHAGPCLCAAWRAPCSDAWVGRVGSAAHGFLHALVDITGSGGTREFLLGGGCFTTLGGLSLALGEERGLRGAGQFPVGGLLVAGSTGRCPSSRHRRWGIRSSGRCFVRSAAA